MPNLYMSPSEPKCARHNIIRWIPADLEVMLVYGSWTCDEVKLGNEEHTVEQTAVLSYI